MQNNNSRSSSGRNRSSNNRNSNNRGNRNYKKNYSNSSRKAFITDQPFFYFLTFNISMLIGTFYLSSLIFEYLNYFLPDNLRAREFNLDIILPLSGFAVLYPISRVLFSLKQKAESYSNTYTSKGKTIFSGLFLIISSAVITGVLISILYKLLNGNIALRFVLKALYLGFVGYILLKYYYFEVKGKDFKNESLIWNISPKWFKIFSCMDYVVLIIFSLYMAGNPYTRRLYHFDNMKIDDVDDLSDYAIPEYYKEYNRVPESLEDCYEKEVCYKSKIKNAQTGDFYKYKRLTGEKYEICVNMNFDKDDKFVKRLRGNRWYSWQDLNYKKGDNCFKYKIIVRDRKHGNKDVDSKLIEN